MVTYNDLSEYYPNDIGVTCLERNEEGMYNLHGSQHVYGYEEIDVSKLLHIKYKIELYLNSSSDNLNSLIKSLPYIIRLLYLITETEEILLMKKLTQK